MSSSMMSARQNASACRALRAWTQAQRGCVAASVQAVLAAWERDWGVQSLQTQEPVVCAAAFEWGEADAAAAVRWQPAPLSGAAGPATGLWWDLVSAGPAASPRPLDALLRDIFGPPADPLNQSAATSVGEVAAEAARAAWIDLWQRVGQAFLAVGAARAGSTEAGTPPAPQPTPATFEQWSGAVVLTLDWCGHELRMLAGGSEVEQLLHDQLVLEKPSATRRAALVPVWDAVAGLAAVVRAELEPVELSVGAVRALRIGDVIGLSHPLDRPVLARTAGGDLLCEAYLGRNGDLRAIELLRTPHKPH